MSYKGHILCRTCKLKLSLGKLIRDEAGRATGFWQPPIEGADERDVMLHFIAEHLEHDLRILGDAAIDDLSDLVEYDSLMQLDPNCKWAREHESINLAGALVWRIPCEPIEARKRRLASGT